MILDDEKAVAGPQIPEPPESGVRRLPVVQPVELTREQRRSRRARPVAARTISTKRMTKVELEVGRRLYPEKIEWRPRKRGDCADGPRPCPFVGCRYHLYLEVSEKTGSIKLNFPDLDPEDMAVSCALDVADDGGDTLEAVGALLNITRERLRQIEVEALTQLERHRDDLIDSDERRRPVRALDHDDHDQPNPEEDSHE